MAHWPRTEDCGRDRPPPIEHGAARADLGRALGRHPHSGGLGRPGAPHVDVTLDAVLLFGAKLTYRHAIELEVDRVFARVFEININKERHL